MTDPDFRGGGIDESSYRLPRSAAPRRYEISLRPDLDAGTFAGSERVEIDVTEPVRELVCNAADLEISSALLHAEGGDVLEAAVTLDAENERATFTLPGEISPGAYALEVEFAGALNEKLRGFYRSTFTDESGRERVIAASQFEVTDARLAFPCWDEPDRKAVFAITLAAPAGIGAWSNGRLVSEADAGDGWTQFRFADTIPMSTYLAAFIVGPLVQTEPRDVDGVALSVVHSPDKPPLTDFALEVAAHALRFFTEFFQIPYPGDKLDLVALPDFSTGAMENLGCITFREPYLLVDPEKAARTELEHVAEVIEHEIAHMWFGDLVTMRWWNGIWLNEAFATFMAALCLDDFRPEWKRWVSFGQDKSAAMTIDGLPSTRPIEFPVRKPDECDAMFDVLTYEKGASVLRMLERYLEPGQFREGVRRYLDAHRYGNTETTDLWDAIESATTEPVRAVMDSWIFQGGYPLVRVRPRPGDRLGVAEAPFSYLPADGTVPAGAAPHAEDATAGGPDVAGAAGGVDPAGSVAGPASGIGTQWFVPVLVEERGAAGEAPAPSRLLLAEPEGDLELHDQRSLAVVNAGGSGFYRLRYEEGLFEKVMGSLDRLTELERYNLVADTWACALAGVGPLEDFLHVVRKLKGEADPSVWSIVTSALVRIDHAVADDEREILQRLVRSLLGPRLATIGWDRAAGEDPRTPTLRSLLIASLGNVGEDPDIIERCRELFEEESAGSRQIAGDTATAVLAIVAAHGGEDEFTAILERYRNPADPQDEMRRLHALGSVRDPRLVADIHRLSLTEVRSQNGPYLLRDMMALNRPAAVQTWRFIEGEFEAMRSRFPKNSLPRMFEGVAGLDELDANDDAVVAADVRSFLAAHPFGGQQLRVDQSFERLEVNVRFAKRQRSSVGKLLDRA